MAENDSILRQILRDADLYQPSVYDLLSFYHSLETVSEPLDGQFVPMTTVQPYEQERTLIFAVGLIPPSATITGRLLDRSASVDRLLGTATVGAEEAEEKRIEEVVKVTPATRGVVTPSRGAQRRSEKKLSEIHASFRPLVEKLIEEAAKEGISLVVRQGVRSNAEQDQLYAKGRTAPGSIVTGVPGGESWHNYGLAVDFGIAQPPNGVPSVAPKLAEWSTVGAIGQSLGLIWGGSFSDLADPGHFEYHPGITIQQAKGGARPSVSSEEYLPVGGTTSVTTSWVVDGSKNANQASRVLAKTSGADLSREKLTDRLSALQRAMSAQMLAAIEQIAKTPPLRLLVNPRSFRTSHEKIIADSGWGREGPILEFWGENQDKIEASGKIAAFFSLDVATGAGPGLTRTARQFSASYQNLMSLYLLYKNNGGVYFPDPLSLSGKSKNLSVLGSVYIYYDGILYIGSFDNFSITEAEDTPFSLEYSFSFTVRASFLLDHLDDAQYTYSRPKMSNSTTSGLTVGNSDPLGSSGFGEQLDPDVALPAPIADLLGGT